jgi:hypothetical protein
MVQEPLVPCSSKGPLDTSLGELNIDDANSQSRMSHKRWRKLITRASSSTTTRATSNKRHRRSDFSRRICRQSSRRDHTMSAERYDSYIACEAELFQESKAGAAAAFSTSPHAQLASQLQVPEREKVPGTSLQGDYFPVAIPPQYVNSLLCGTSGFAALRCIRFIAVPQGRCRLPFVFTVFKNKAGMLFHKCVHTGLWGRDALSRLRSCLTRTRGGGRLAAAPAFYGFGWDVAANSA